MSIIYNYSLLNDCSIIEIYILDHKWSIGAVEGACCPAKHSPPLSCDIADKPADGSTGLFVLASGIQLQCIEQL